MARTKKGGQSQGALSGPKTRLILILLLPSTLLSNITIEHHFRASSSIIFEHHLRTSSSNIIFEHHLRASSSSITFDHHLRPSPSRINFEHYHKSCRVFAAYHSQRIKWISCCVMSTKTCVRPSESQEQIFGWLKRRVGYLRCNLGHRI